MSAVSTTPGLAATTKGSVLGLVSQTGLSIGAAGNKQIINVAGVNNARITGNANTKGTVVGSVVQIGAAAGGAGNKQQILVGGVEGNR